MQKEGFANTVKTTSLTPGLKNAPYGTRKSRQQIVAINSKRKKSFNAAESGLEKVKSLYGSSLQQ